MVSGLDKDQQRSVVLRIGTNPPIAGAQGKSCAKRVRKESEMNAPSPGRRDSPVQLLRGTVAFATHAVFDGSMNPDLWTLLADCRL